jgi:hypothetical protein
MRENFVNWLRERVPPARWEQIWWIAPATTLLLLPIGLPLLWLVQMIGWYVFQWDGEGRAVQGLMLFAVTSGVVVGSVVLWSVRAAQLAPENLRRAQWLARFAIPGPFLTLLVLFWTAT